MLLLVLLLPGVTNENAPLGGSFGGMSGAVVDGGKLPKSLNKEGAYDGEVGVYDGEVGAYEGEIGAYEGKSIICCCCVCC